MIDMHVHFFPRGLFEAIWAYFEREPGGYWKIHEKAAEQALVDALRREGVRRFTTLVYAHKPGVASGLNDFVAEWAARVPEIIPIGTIYAGDADMESYARRALEEQRFVGMKLHPVVSRELLDDARFFPVYEMMSGLGRVLVAHAGSGPQGYLFDGPERVRRILRRFPKLKIVVAHCGAVEYEAFGALAEEFEGVYFDTAMNSTPVTLFEGNCPGAAFYRRHAGRILFGTDYPNVPYPYATQRRSIEALGLGASTEDSIFRSNAERLLAEIEGSILNA